MSTNENVLIKSWNKKGKPTRLSSADGKSIKDHMDDLELKIKKCSVKIYKIQVEVAGTIFRALALFDHGQLIVMANAFQKKTQKTPKNKIDLAKQIIKEYFDEKQKIKPDLIC